MINLEGVDWTGRLVGRCEFNFKPVPVVSQNSDLYQSILYWSKVMQESLLPAQPEEIFEEVSNLKLHFLGNKLSERESEVLVKDYIVDLSFFPFDLIKFICREYRLSNNQYFPKVGQLYTMLVPLFSARISKANKLLALIEASESNQTNNDNY